MKEKETNEKLLSLCSLVRALLVSIKFLFLFALNELLASERTGSEDWSGEAHPIVYFGHVRPPYRLHLAHSHSRLRRHADLIQ